MKTENQPIVKFDKSFEALYKIAMTMADTTIGAKTIDDRFEKLEEEYQELIEAFQDLDNSLNKIPML